MPPVSFLREPVAKFAIILGNSMVVALMANIWFLSVSPSSLPGKDTLPANIYIHSQPTIRSRWLHVHVVEGAVYVTKRYETTNKYNSDTSKYSGQNSTEAY